MRTYCYHFRRANSGQKIIGGMLHASSMENAARKVILMHNMEVEITHHGCSDTAQWSTHQLKYQGKKVHVYVSVHPEYLDLGNNAQS